MSTDNKGRLKLRASQRYRSVTDGPTELLCQCSALHSWINAHASENSLCNVSREQASRHIWVNSLVNLVCLNCRRGGCYVMRYARRSLVTVSEVWTVDYWLSRNSNYNFVRTICLLVCAESFSFLYCCHLTNKVAYNYNALSYSVANMATACLVVTQCVRVWYLT